MHIIKITFKKATILLCLIMTAWYGVIYTLNYFHEGYLDYTLQHSQKSFRAMHVGAQKYFYQYFLLDNLDSSHILRRTRASWKREVSLLQVRFYHKQARNALNIASQHSKHTSPIISELENALQDYAWIFESQMHYDRDIMSRLDAVKFHVYQEFMNIDHNTYALREYQRWLRISEAMMILCGLILSMMLMNYFIVQPMVNRWRKKVTS